MFSRSFETLLLSTLVLAACAHPDKPVVRETVDAPVVTNVVLSPPPSSNMPKPPGSLPTPDAQPTSTLIAEYFRNLKTRGRFEHVAAAIVLDPQISRTAFHLIYATRNVVGLQVFKAAEKSAMHTMLEAQEAAALRRRQTDKIHGDLFGPIDVIVPKRYETLRARYGGMARELVISLLASKKTISYDVAWRAALTFPLVWESDLKEWIASWQHDGSVTVNGLGPRERVPKLEQRHTLTFVSDHGISTPVKARSRTRKTGR